MQGAYFGLKAALHNVRFCLAVAALLPYVFATLTALRFGSSAQTMAAPYG